MPTINAIGYYSPDELLDLLGIAYATDPELAGIAGLSWSGNALKVIQVNATENGWQLAAITGFTDEGAQDAVGGILTDTATIDLTYNDATPSITADVKPASITAAMLAATTGTGNVVLSASPTLTGTLAGAAATFSGEVKGSKFSVGNETEQGVDPVFVAKRLVDNSVSGSGHAFSDSSVVTRTSGTVAYNSFEARHLVNGAGNYDHFSGFQANQTISTSGTTTDYYGFFTAPVIDNGTVTRATAFKVYSFRGTATYGTVRGLLIEALDRGTTRYAIDQQGAVDFNLFAGRVDIANCFRVTNNANAFTTGVGVEINFNTGGDVGNVLAYNRGTSAYKSLYVDGLNVILRASGADVLTVASSSVTFAQPAIFLNSSGIKILDTNASHTLGLIVGTNLTANRTFTITTGDANRTFDISAGDVTVTTGGAALVGLTGAASKVPYFTGASAAATTDFEAAAANTSHTPVLTPATGAITSYTSSCSYCRVGKMIIGSITATITNAGTGAGVLNITLPFTAAAAGFWLGEEFAVTGNTVKALVSASSNLLRVSEFAAGATVIATNKAVRIGFAFLST